VLRSTTSRSCVRGSFPRPGETLRSNFKVTSQAKDYDHHFLTDKQYVENVRWEERHCVRDAQHPRRIERRCHPGTAAAPATTLPQDRDDSIAPGRRLRAARRRVGEATEGHARRS
jgi:hypothetical protein